MTLPPHEWLRARRHALKLRQKEVERRTGTLDGWVYVVVLGELERGTRPLSSLRPAQVNALRQTLGITAEEWAAQTAPPQQAEDQP